MEEAAGDVDIVINSFQKMSESSKARRRWTEEEDTKLRRLVAATEENDLVVWRDVATKIVARNANQCRERWTNHLRPGIRRGNWLAEEDETIERLQKTIGNQWSTIASNLDRRTDIDVKNRFHKLQRSSKRNRCIVKDEPLDIGLRTNCFSAPAPTVGMKVLVKFEEEGYNKMYDGTITQVEEQPDASFKLQIQYEDGSFEDDCNYPDDDIYLVDCRSSNDGLTEEEVSLSSELLNIHYSLLSNDKPKAKKRKTSIDEAKKRKSSIDVQDDQNMISTKENYHINLTDHS
ncbi:SANT/Myb-like DNA-binding domain-containing protein [Skeletonema marinoi]|uniref:SANT/Myb-like DNA-binding domain-containing protein n=1 Tax=Skeletonema marinoi TaxID=267567 RepID=A0AAD8XXG7_9STRA|nr:SANT/Myb-like DNA-binding domain-containing protein [Skeletonema marinoi]